MQNGRERNIVGNFYPNNTDHGNRSWNNNFNQHINNSNNRRQEFGNQTNNSDSFTKFRDRSQQQPQQNHHQPRHQQQQRSRGGGGGGQYGKQENQRSRKNGRRGRGRRESNGGGKNQGRRGRGQNESGRHSEGDTNIMRYQEPMDDDMFYFTNGKLSDETAPPDVSTTLVPPPEAPMIGSPAPTVAPLNNLINIKKEKKEDVTPKKIDKSKESNEESSSSSSDESFEKGEVIKKPAKKPQIQAKVKTEAIAQPAALPPSSSSEEDSSSDEDVPPVKTKSSAKEIASKSPKALRKVPSEDDVVCIGNESRKYTIPDEDHDDAAEGLDSSEDETETKQKKNKDKPKDLECGICDKKVSFNLFRLIALY